MKILMISSGFPPKINTGAEKFCYELSKRLIQNGVKVEVASHTDLIEYDGIKLYQLFKFKNKYSRKVLFDYYNPVNVLKIKRILVTFQPDIIHFHNIYGISTQLIGYVAKKCSVVITAHDYWPFCFNSTMVNEGEICRMNCGLCRFPLGFITRKIKAHHLKNVVFIAPSNFMKDKLLSAGFANVETIYNGIDVPKKKANISKRLVYVGRINPEKGILFLIEAIKYIDEKLDVIGDGSLLPYLKKNYSNDKNINFKGFVENIDKEYKSGGIYVVPSTWPENLPYVILEAMSYGLPVIASKVGGMPEMIEDGKTGFLFDHNNLDDLKDKIILSLENPELIKKISYAARNKVEENFNWNNTIENYLSLYSRILK